MKKSVILLSILAITLALPVEVNAGVLTYKPPLSGAPAERVGGGTRGKLVVPKIQVLAPEEIALTSTEQPVFYWYVAEAKEQTVEFMLSKYGETEPLLKKTFSTADKGVQSLKLTDDVSLEADVNYRWSVKIISGNAGDIVSNAIIRYQSPVILLETVEQKAENGYWYDVMQELIESHSPLANDLLKQIGLRVPTL